jgi:hypothetical protein
MKTVDLLDDEQIKCVNVSTSDVQLFELMSEEEQILCLKPHN